MRISDTRVAVVLFSLAAVLLGVAAYLYVRSAPPAAVTIDIAQSQHQRLACGTDNLVRVTFTNRGADPVRLLGIATT